MDMLLLSKERECEIYKAELDNYFAMGQLQKRFVDLKNFIKIYFYLMKTKVKSIIIISNITQKI